MSEPLDTSFTAEVVGDGVLLSFAPSFEHYSFSAIKLTVIRHQCILKTRAKLFRDSSSLALSFDIQPPGSQDADSVYRLLSLYATSRESTPWYAQTDAEGTRLVSAPAGGSGVAGRDAAKVSGIVFETDVGGEIWIGLDGEDWVEGTLEVHVHPDIQVPR